MRARIASIGFAIKGIRLLVAGQANARFHLAATLVVAAAAYLSDVTRTEWALLIFAIGMVWAAEALNTAIELTVDLASPEQHPLAGQAKDVAAGGVLIASIAAAAIGLIVFVPKWF